MCCDGFQGNKEDKKDFDLLILLLTSFLQSSYKQPTTIINIYSGGKKVEVKNV